MTDIPKEIKLNQPMAYIKVGLYGIPIITKKTLRVTKRYRGYFNKQYIDRKYLRYLTNEPSVKHLTSMVVRWVKRNMDDIDLRYACWDILEKLDKNELMRVCINKDLIK